MNFLFLTMGYPSAKNQSSIVFLQRLVHELVDQGHQATVICPVKWQDSKGFLHEELHTTNKQNMVHVYYPRYAAAWIGSRVKKDVIRDIGVRNYIRAVRKIIEREKISFDCVYSHFLGVSMLTAVKIGQEYQKPVFAAAGESRFRFFETPDREETIANLNQLNGIISVSAENKRLLLANGVLDDERICVYPNGINSEVFYPRDKKNARMKFDFDQKSFIVAFVGHFIERKGPLRLLEAGKDLPVKLAFAGKGEQLPVGDNVVWNKPVNASDMAEFLSAADIFVLPTQNEGCCNAIIEAMACGLPVVSSNRPFNQDILDENCAILIEPDHVDEIRSAIMMLHDDTQHRKEMTQACIEKGRSLSISARADAIAEFIKSKM